MNLNGSVCLSLAEGVMHDVFVSSIVGGGKFFCTFETVVMIWPQCKVHFMSAGLSR